METTLNIHTDILEMIRKGAELRGISCSAMIIELLQKVMDESAQPIVIGRLVRYQQRNKHADWHTFHVQLRADEYEYFLDMRKLRKMSVSFILAYAAKRYLRKMNKDNVTDNNRYQYRNYVVVREFIGNIPCWKLIWGYPPLIEQHISH